MTDPRHHSIGEVLSMLKEEHADVTISKIRFFESQGLIDPERTPSGYRKFYDADIDRLRWILLQQRDNFLPLKVIKRRLEEDGFDPTAEVVVDHGSAPPEPTLFTKPEGAATGRAADVGEVEKDSEAQPAPEPAAESAPTAESPTQTAPEPDEKAEAPAEPEAKPAPARRAAAKAPRAPKVKKGDPLDPSVASVSLTPRELAEAAGIELDLVTELERLGLIETIAGDGAAYDHEALVVAKAAAVFHARGAEPRHLRMYKVAADREAGLLEQLVGPKLKRGGDTKKAARAELNEMVKLGEAIHRSILRRGFGSQLD